MLTLMLAAHVSATAHCATLIRAWFSDWGSTGSMNAPSWRKSSIFLGRIVGVMFMRVNSKCAHQVRPPLSQMGGFRRDRSELQRLANRHAGP
jgi:hypothetical protein